MYRILYKSSSKNPLDWSLVREILRTSDHWNGKNSITGLLLATETRFLQVLEGERQSVNETFMRIVRDDRHEAIELISFSPTETRLFSGWNMRGIGVFNLNQDIETELVSKYGEEDGTVRFPIEEWEALSMINEVQQPRYKLTNAE